VAEAGGNFGCIRTDRLHDFAAIGDDGMEGGLDAVHHDVDQQPRRWRRRPPAHPRAAHLSRTVIKRGGAITALPQLPSKDLGIEVGGAANVDGRNLDVADLSVTECWRHKKLLSSCLTSRRGSLGWPVPFQNPCPPSCPCS